MPPHRPIKKSFFFTGPVWRATLLVHIYESRLSFTLCKGFTSTKILLTSHYRALGGDSFYIATLKLMFYTYGF
jgi:hypothetical protein